MIFTEQGFQKLQLRIKAYENGEKYGAKLTFEKLSEITGLAYNTVFKVFKREKGVDKRTLAKFFLMFDLELDSDDYTLSGSWARHSCKCNVEWANLSNTLNVSELYGRTTELTTIKQWLVDDCCRLVTVYGMGGIGKTVLSVKLVKEIEGKFERVLWISLQKAPPLKQVLANLMRFLLDEHQSEMKLANSTTTNFAKLFNYLRLYRCLIVFDRAETIMQAGVYSGCYREEYQNYGQLIRYMAEISHRSSFLLISRELPKEVSIFDGDNLAVKNIELNSLQQVEGLKFFQKQKITGSISLKNKLIENCAGNPFALKKVIQKIEVVYGGDIYEFTRKNEVLCNDIKNFLAQHYQRLSRWEKMICCKLTTYTDPISLLQLQKDFMPSIPPMEIVISLESLLRRSLIIVKDDSFKLNPLFHKYVILICCF